MARAVWRRWARALPLVGAPLLLSGCPLPIRHAQAVSAPLEGVVLRADGRPAVGREVAVSHASGDSTCARAVLRTETDASGRFRLPAVQRQYRVLWVIPNFDPAPGAYALCVGTADTLRPAYQGRGSLGPEAPLDSLTCREWEWRGRIHVSCAGEHAEPFITGGEWAHGSATGWFRLIRTEIGPEKGPDGSFLRPRLVVQWVEGVPPPPGERVLATAALPPEDRARGVRELGPPLLIPTRGGWCLSVSGRVATGWSGERHEPLIYLLGAPGQMTSVAECPPSV